MAAVLFLFCLAMGLHLATLVGVVYRMVPHADFTGVHAFLVSLAGRVAFAFAWFATSGLPDGLGALAALVALVLGDAFALSKLADLSGRQTALAIGQWYGIHLLLAVVSSVVYAVVTSVIRLG